MGVGFLRYVTTLRRLTTMSIAKRSFHVLICHVILCAHVFKGLRDLVGVSLLQ